MKRGPTGTCTVDGFLIRKTRWMCVSGASGRQDLKIKMLHAAGRSFECRWLQLSQFALQVQFSRMSLFSLHFFPPPFNLLSKEIKAQRTGGLIKVDVLALELVALHKQVGF